MTQRVAAAGVRDICAAAANGAASEACWRLWGWAKPPRTVARTHWRARAVGSSFAARAAAAAGAVRTAAASARGIVAGEYELVLFVISQAVV